MKSCRSCSTHEKKAHRHVSWLVHQQFWVRMQVLASLCRFLLKICVCLKAFQACIMCYCSLHPLLVHGSWKCFQCQSGLNLGLLAFFQTRIWLKGSVQLKRGLDRRFLCHSRCLHLWGLALTRPNLDCLCVYWLSSLHLVIESDLIPRDWPCLVPFETATCVFGRLKVRGTAPH